MGMALTTFLYSLSQKEPFGYIAPSNWKKVKMRDGKPCYWTNEITGASSWVHPPPDVVYHRPPPKSITLSYAFAFAKPPSQTLEEANEEGVDTAIFYDPPPLPQPDTMSPIKNNVIETTNPVHIKMN